MPRKIHFAKTAKRVTAHQAESKVERDRFYSGTRWRKTRQAFLRENPFCLECFAMGEPFVPATIPHHKVERLQNPDLAYNWDNLMPLCASHHSRFHSGQKPWNRR